MTEAQLEKWARQAAKDVGVLMYKFRSPTKRGVPDDILFYEGSIILVEFKSPSKIGVISPLQKKEIILFCNAGFHVFVVNSKERFGEVLAAFVNGEYR